jgi:hypothetical protein
MTTTAYSVVNMMKFGIKTAVLASHSTLDWYANEYRTQPDYRFGGGIGKKKFLEGLSIHLPIEDEYFNKNPIEAIEENQRWCDFCEGCIIYATLYAFMNKEPVVLMHPDSYDESEKFNSSHDTIHSKPSLIPGIITINSKENST